MSPVPLADFQPARGADWSRRLPRIIEAMPGRASSVSVDGEAVVCGEDGRLSRPCTSSGATASAIVYAFDRIDFTDLRRGRAWTHAVVTATAPCSTVRAGLTLVLAEAYTHATQRGGARPSNSRTSSTAAG